MESQVVPEFSFGLLASGIRYPPTPLFHDKTVPHAKDGNLCDVDQSSGWHFEEWADVVSGQYIPRHDVIFFDNHVLDSFSKALNSIMGALDRVSNATMTAQHSEPCMGHKISGVDRWDSGKISRAPDVMESLD
jgi:hypothetical protein